MKTALSFAALMLAIVPSSLSAQNSADFKIDETAFAFEVPEGFCLPTGETVQIVDYLASIDPKNDTLVHTDRCGTFGEDYLQIKVPKTRQSFPLPRSVFLNIMATQLDTEAGKKAIDDGFERGNNSLSENTDGVITVPESAIRYWGRDGQCVYLQGASKVEAVGSTGWIYFAACLTLVGSYGLSVNSYGPLADPDAPATGQNLEDTYKALCAQSSAAAQAINPKE